jgi:hypothetical protein
VYRGGLQLGALAGGNTYARQLLTGIITDGQASTEFSLHRIGSP